MNSQAKPRVSVIIASYNHARYLRETLNSVMSQTFKDFELVVVDDGSKDDSLAILQEFSERYPNFSYYTHPENANKGISITSNLAIKNSVGEYIGLLGSDDVWHPDLLESQMNLFDSNPEFDLVYSLAQYIDSDGNVGCEGLGELLGGDIARSENIVKSLVSYNPIPALTVVFKRKCVDEVGDFDPALIYSDWELWIRIANISKIGFNEKALANYRVHGENVSFGQNRKLVKYEERYCALIRALERKSQTSGGALADAELLALYKLEIMAYERFIGNELLADESCDAALKISEEFSLTQEFFLSWIDSKQYEDARKSYFGFRIWFVKRLAKRFPELNGRQVALSEAMLQAQEALDRGDLQTARKRALRCLSIDPVACRRMYAARKLFSLAYGDIGIVSSAVSFLKMVRKVRGKRGTGVQVGK